MIYTIILTENKNGNFKATVPNFPDCIVEAETRSKALNNIRNAIVKLIGHSEIIQLDVPVEPNIIGAYRDTPWELFGAFKNDPMWGKVFDRIEYERDAKKNQRFD